MLWKCCGLMSFCYAHYKQRENVNKDIKKCYRLKLTKTQTALIILMHYVEKFKF